ncbi:hypothetical protein [Amycolatopsis sp. FDAARGOS 1241]|uniref:hypothetical protein n=1 Tax=Amycolatopsis sp. FDAARGOS 1241 TaxID=2778070 RepID=UPI001951A7FC|nr:hypothetical protein [Amycolatopsis sp. FDAARGOS 1241]QRP42893.1 hypothetical protein I6J71_25875 [Amycolatopsis sp. FDAARGOS 1241]
MSHGALVAVGQSILELLRRTAWPHDGILGVVRGLTGMHDVDDYTKAVVEPSLVKYRTDVALCFANVEDFRRRALAAASRRPRTGRWFVVTLRPTSNSTSPRPTLSTSCVKSSSGTASCWRSSAASRTCATTSKPRDWWGRWGKRPTLPTAVGDCRNWLAAPG